MLYLCKALNNDNHQIHQIQWLQGLNGTAESLVVTHFGPCFEFNYTLADRRLRKCLLL